MMKAHQPYNLTRQRVYFKPTVCALAVTACLGATLEIQAQRLFLEDFEELTLGPNVEESISGAKVWTKTAPAGWTIDDSKIPGIGDTSKDGRTEWAGWSFANKDWWVRAAENQRRVEFTLGQGAVMIADPDEWDDAAHEPGLFETTITSAPIGITNAPVNSLVLVFDSSWRPEATDDGAPNFPVDADGNAINDQTGFITAAFDSSAASEILRWDSINGNDTYHGHLPNESVVIPLNNPAGAKNLVLKFGMEKAANDWWWALDNIAVGIPPFASGIAADGVSFVARIVQTAGKKVDQGKGVTVELDGKAVTPVELTTEGDYLMVKHSQAPAIFVPGSQHTVKLKFTSSENKALEDTLTFVAPSYTALEVTPVVVAATVMDVPDWGITVDESKGVKLELDGAPVNAASVSRSDTNVLVRFVQTQPFVAQSSHTMKVIFTTSTGQQVTDAVKFTAPEFTDIPAALATAPGTGAQPGMRWRTHQIDGTRANTIAATEQQLRGDLGPSVHDTTGQGADGFFPIDFVNFDQNTGDAGNFNSAAVPPQNVSDLGIPGIPGVNGGTDYIAAEGVTFLDLQAGVYTMVVNSDDGFQVSAGTTNSPTQLVLGKWDAGRGASDTAFHFKINQAGVYLFRLLYFEGTSEARVEWFTVNTDGSRALVGGTQTGALKAYRVRTVAEPSVPANSGIGSYTITGGKLMLTFTGTLKSATSISGPFQPVAGASSPHGVTLSGAQQFFIAQ